MSPGGRGTRTGAIWEATLLPALEMAYPGRVLRHQNVGRQLFGGHYVADIVINQDSGSIVISAKWQQITGTAEQKLLYEIASLISVIRESGGRYAKAYVIIGGPGFSARARAFLLAQGHVAVLKDGGLVQVTTLDSMIAKANERAL